MKAVKTACTKHYQLVGDGPPDVPLDLRRGVPQGKHLAQVHQDLAEDGGGAGGVDVLVLVLVAGLLLVDADLEELEVILEKIRKRVKL